MSPAQVFKVYIWLVDTISSGHLSKDDIDRRWAHSAINEYGEPDFPTRKFHRYKEDIYHLFGIVIRCNRRKGYYYMKSANPILLLRWHIPTGITSWLTMPGNCLKTKRKTWKTQPTPSNNCPSSI